MQGIVEVTGMIIKAIPIGEYDKRITILTLEKGKIGVFVRGARKINNIFMGSSNIFAFGKFFLYEGRDSYTLQSAKVKQHFDELTKDIETTCYATYFLELVNYYSRQYLIEPDMLTLLYISLIALTKKSIPHRLTRRIFELRLMCIVGEYDYEIPIKASDTTKYTWNYILTSRLDKLYTFNINEESLKELESAVDSMLSKYLDSKMNSLDMLEMILS